MDIRRDGFFAHLTLNGREIPIDLQGSVMHLVGEALKGLSIARNRGDSDIVIRISSKPIDTTKAGLASFNRVAEVESELELPDTSDDVPREGESYEEYYQRLADSGMGTVAAEMIAADWFQRERNPKTTAWLTDSMAIRFRELNSRDEAYENAMPNEYEQLKHYVTREYPSFCEHLTFRTA